MLGISLFRAPNSLETRNSSVKGTFDPVKCWNWWIQQRWHPHRNQTWESLRSSTVCTAPAEMSSLVPQTFAQAFGQALDLDLKMNADVYPEKKEEYFCLLQYHHYHSHQSHQNPLPGMSQTTFFVAPNRKRRTSWSIAARGSYLKPTGSAGMLHCPHLSRALSGRRIAQHQPLWNQWSIPSLLINQCEKDMTKPKLLRAMSNPCWYIVSHSMIMRNCVVCFNLCLSRHAITISKHMGMSENGVYSQL